MIREAIGIYSFSRGWAPVLFRRRRPDSISGFVPFLAPFLDRESVITPGHPKVLQAFLVAGSLFAGFLIADEVFIVYVRRSALATTHVLVLCALLLSLVLISLPRDDARRQQFFDQI